MHPAPSTDSINKKTKSNKLEMAAICTIIGFLLFLISYYSSLSVESRSLGRYFWGRFFLVMFYVF